MKDQVVMSPNNAQLAIAIPLFRWVEQEEIASLGTGYSVSITNGKPLAYVLDMDKHGCQVMSAEWVEKHLTFLGDL